MRKVVHISTALATIAAGSRTNFISPWVSQPIEGHGETQIGVAVAAKQAIEPEVLFEIYDTSSDNNRYLDLGIFEQTLRVSNAGVDGQESPYTLTENISGCLQLNQGSVHVALDPAALSQASLLLTNNDTVAHTLFVRITVTGEFQPHPAPALVQDVYRKGWCKPEPPRGSAALKSMAEYGTIDLDSNDWLFGDDPMVDGGIPP